MLYSLLTNPPERIFSKLKAKIDELSDKYNGPKFDPHLTILGNIEGELSDIEEKVKTLASGLQTLELELSETSFSTTYFQNVFVRVKSNAALMNLNLKAKELFGMENNVFMPHVSLLYGDQDMKTREEAVSEIEIEKESFIVDKFVIITSGNDPNTWEIVSEIRFNE